MSLLRFFSEDKVRREKQSLPGASAALPAPSISSSPTLIGNLQSPPPPPPLIDYSSPPPALQHHRPWQQSPLAPQFLPPPTMFAAPVTSVGVPSITSGPPWYSPAPVVTTSSIPLVASSSGSDHMGQQAFPAAMPYYVTPEQPQHQQQQALQGTASLSRKVMTGSAISCEEPTEVHFICKY